MSLSITLQNAVAGLRVTQTATQVVGANIANAHDPDYTRKVVQQSAYTQSGGPSGPYIAGIERRTAETLLRDLQALVAQESGAQTRSALASRLADTFGLDSGESPLLTQLSRLERAWRDLEATPQNGTLAWAVIQAADELVREVHRLSDALTRQELETRQEVGRQVESLNVRIAEIDTLNRQISSLRAAGETTGDLEDKRDSAVRELAKLVDIRTIEQANGRLQVYTATGYQLVGGEVDGVAWTGELLSDLETGQMLNDTFRGGSIGTLLKALDDSKAGGVDAGAGTFASLRQSLDAFAETLAAEINGAHGSTIFELPGAPPGSAAASLRIAPDYLDGSQTVDSTRAGAVAQQIAGGSIGELVRDATERLARFAADSKAEAERVGMVKSNLEAKFRGLVGVDVDTEVAELIALQNAYAANARIMQTVADMYDTLLNAVRR